MLTVRFLGEYYANSPKHLKCQITDDEMIKTNSSKMCLKHEQFIWFMSSICT
jgi:hypothetical protein